MCLTGPAIRPGKLKKAKKDKLEVEGEPGSAYNFYYMWHVTSPKRKCQLEIQVYLQLSVRIKAGHPSFSGMYKILGYLQDLRFKKGEMAQ